MQNALDTYSNFLKQKQISIPQAHIVLGSGFGKALDGLKADWSTLGELPFASIPGLPVSNVPDHSGAFRFMKNTQSGVVVIFQMGRIHGYEGHSPKIATMPVLLSRFLGVKNFLLTNAAGGLRMNYKAGDAMVIRDHVNLTGMNPLIGNNPQGLDGKELGPRFPDLNQAYDLGWRQQLQKSLGEQGLNVHEGVYLGLLGPSFETPAEVQLFASWGLHAVGMSTVWETIALKHSGAKVAGLSLISNLGAGLDPNQSLNHTDIVETCRASAERIVKGIAATLRAEVLS